MLRTLQIISTTAALLMAGSFSALQAQQAPAPDTVVMEGSPVGTVTFSHAEHQTMTDCVACHHESRPEKPATDQFQPCDDCHTKSPSPPMTTSLRDAFHDVRAQAGVCIDCHKNEEQPDAAQAPVRCNACHVKRNN